MSNLEAEAPRTFVVVEKIYRTIFLRLFEGHGYQVILVDRDVHAQLEKTGLAQANLLQ